MAKIIDPDLLNRGVEYQYDTTTPAARTFQLLVAGNLDDSSPGFTSGATGQAVYSRMILDFAEDAAAGQDLRKHGFPLAMTTESQGGFNPSWAPADAQSRDLFRDFGWTEPDGQQWAGLSMLDTSGDADQSTYQQTAGGAETVSDFDKTGRLNEAVQVHDGVTPLNTFLQLRNRIQGKQHSGFEVVSRLNLATVQARLYQVLLGNATDPKIVTSDGDIDTLAPFTGMSVDYLTGDHTGVTTWVATTAYAAGDIVTIVGVTPDRFLRCTVGGTSAGSEPSGAGVDGTVTWEVDPGERQIGANYYHFSRILEGNVGTAQQMQNWGQRELRKLTDINADTNGDAFGAVNGVNAEELFNTPSAFEGDVLVLERGVYTDNFDGASANLLKFLPHLVDGADASGTDAAGQVKFPFKVNIKFLASANMIGGIATLFFTNDDAGDNTGRDFDTDDAIIVQDDTLTPIDFIVAGATTNFTFDYDANIQRGAASASEDAPVTAHFLYPGSSKPITAVSTLTQSDNVDIRLDGQDDPVFSNP